MSPKLVFTKEKVLAAALELARRKGIESVSARNVAKAIKSSVAPIYSCFNSTEELKKAVLKMAHNILIEYTTKDYTDKIFLNIGVGFVRFARDDSALFKALFLEENNFKDISQDFFEFIRYRMSLDTDFKEMPDEAVQNLFLDMWTYVNGLAVMISAGLQQDKDDKFIIQNLARIGAAIISSYLGKFDSPDDIKIYL